MFVTFINFFFISHKSTLTTIEILMLSSWIPASKEFFSMIFVHIMYTMLFNTICRHYVYNIFRSIQIKSKSMYTSYLQYIQKDSKSLIASQSISKRLKASQSVSRRLKASQGISKCLKEYQNIPKHLKVSQRD